MVIGNSPNTHYEFVLQLYNCKTQDTFMWLGLLTANNLQWNPQLLFPLATMYLNTNLRKTLIQNELNGAGTTDTEH